MTDERKCTVCGKMESQAKAEGDVGTGEISVEDEYLLMKIGATVKENSFLCLACKVKAINSLTGGKLDRDQDSMQAFRDFIVSSGFLFKLESSHVAQASFSVVMICVASMPAKIGLKVLETTVKIVEKEIDDIRGRIAAAEELEEEEKRRKKKRDDEAKLN